MPRKTTYLGLIAAVAFGSFGYASVASGAAMTCGQFTLGDATACTGPIGGNDPYPRNLEQLGETWFAIDKDDAQNVSVGNDPDTRNPESWFYGTAAPGQSPTDARSGTWTLDPAIWGLYDQLVIALKAANEFSVFVLEAGDLSGIWSTASNGLSHASLYGIPGDGRAGAGTRHADAARARAHRRVDDPPAPSGGLTAGDRRGLRPPAPGAGPHDSRGRLA